MKTFRLPLSPAFAGFLQALGIVLYVVAFSWLSMIIGPRIAGPYGGPQLISMALFLLAFCMSALICATLVLGYPVILVLQKQWKKGVQVFAWTLAWSVIIALLFLFSVLATVVPMMQPPMMY